MTFPLSDSSLEDVLATLGDQLPFSPKQISPSPISKRHSTSKTSPRPKVFACPFPDCDRRSARKWNIELHSRLHTGNTPLICRVGCGKAFKWPGSRNRHESQRCKYATNMKSRTRQSVQNTRGRTIIISRAGHTTLPAFRGSSSSYLSSGVLLDRSSASTYTKDSDVPTSLTVPEETSDVLTTVIDDFLEIANDDNSLNAILFDCSLEELSS